VDCKPVPIISTQFHCVSKRDTKHFVQHKPERNGPVLTSCPNLLKGGGGGRLIFLMMEAAKDIQFRPACPAQLQAIQSTCSGSGDRVFVHNHTSTLMS
jgi:hypothetical protein